MAPALITGLKLILVPLLSLIPTQRAPGIPVPAIVPHPLVERRGKAVSATCPARIRVGQWTDKLALPGIVQVGRHTAAFTSRPALLFAIDLANLRS